MGDAELNLIEQQWLFDRGLQHLDLPRRVVGNTEMADLAGGGELVEGRSDVLRLDQSIGSMQQQHVEIVGTKRGERFIDRLQNVLGREIEKPLRMPTLLWIRIFSRSTAESVMASPNRSSQRWRSPP